MNKGDYMNIYKIVFNDGYVILLLADSFSHNVLTNLVTFSDKDDNAVALYRFTDIKYIQLEKTERV